jgi:hypothetical protein
VPKASFITLQLARFDALLTNPGQSGAERADGVLFCGVAADTRGAATEPATQQAFVFAMISLHADEGSARALLHERSSFVPWMNEAKESWGAVLRPYRCKGEVNWIDRASPGQVFDLGAAPGADTPFVVITSVGWRTGPDLDMNRVRDFGAGVLGIRASMAGTAGLRSAQSFFFPGVLAIDPPTVSFWEGDAAARAFAYGGGVHRMQMERSRELATADRLSFTRAVAIEAYGTWCGADPLRGGATVHDP